MTNQILTINAIAAVLIIFVYWWFFVGESKSVVSKTNEPITIVVKDGIYLPSMIKIPAGKEVKLTFLRKDISSCAGTVSFPQLNISYQLPMDQLVEITIPPQKQGEIDFTCAMGMYRGKLLVL